MQAVLEETQAAPPYRYRWIALFVILAVEVMDLLDSLVTTIAGPSIRVSRRDRFFKATAEEVLDRCSAGDGRAIFPTRRLLERLARFDSFEAARDEAERLPQRTISPWIEQREGGDWLCIPEGAGYPVTSEPIATAFRY